jgi:DNA-directed RNA polymerase subunit F
MKTVFSRSLPLALLLLAGNALAQSTPAQSLPDWDKLTPQQREVLISQVRERWNNDPDQRPRMLEHAQRWKNMSPEQRKQARKGMRRFEDMNPQQREEARVLFEQMKKLSPEQRNQLREDWQRMTPEQRRAWVEKNAPKDPANPPIR